MRLRLIIAAVALAISTAGVVLGVLAAREMPRRFSAGAHQLRMSIRGTGAPAVVLETIGLAPLETWGRIQAQLSEFTRVVSYDHAGHSGSELGPRPRDAIRIARELRIALRAADIAPPYILVGYSFGGPYVRVFAGLYPEDVAGIVLVDPTQESFMAMLSEKFPEINVVTEEHRREREEWGMSWESMRQAGEAVLPEVPITLITGRRAHDTLSEYLLPLWQAEHEMWLRQYPHAAHIVTTNSGHGVIFTEPEIIVRAVLEMASRNPKSRDQEVTRGLRVPSSGNSE